MVHGKMSNNESQSQPIHDTTGKLSANVHQLFTYGASIVFQS